MCRGVRYPRLYVKCKGHSLRSHGQKDYKYFDILARHVAPGVFVGHCDPTFQVYIQASLELGDESSHKTASTSSLFKNVSNGDCDRPSVCPQLYQSLRYIEIQVNVYSQCDLK